MGKKTKWTEKNIYEIVQNGNDLIHVEEIRCDCCEQVTDTKVTEIKGTDTYLGGLTYHEVVELDNFIYEFVDDTKWFDVNNIDGQAFDCGIYGSCYGKHDGDQMFTATEILVRMQREYKAGDKFSKVVKAAEKRLTALTNRKTLNAFNVKAQRLHDEYEANVAAQVTEFKKAARIAALV